LRNSNSGGSADSNLFNDITLALFVFGFCSLGFDSDFTLVLLFFFYKPFNVSSNSLFLLLE
jgi:hypothetical protein